MVDAAQVAQWLEKLKQGSLVAADLECALQCLKQGGGQTPVQRLLYLQTNTTDLESPVLGMTTVEDGVVKYYGGQGPWGYKPEEVEEWLAQRFPEQKL